MKNKEIEIINEYPDGIEIIVGTCGYAYHIPKISYTDRIDKISDWINQIMNKTWSDVNSLYQLGSKLSKHTLNSGISWTDTFFMVEKQAYIEKEFEKVYGVVDDHNFTYNKLLKQLELGRALSNDEVHNKIEMIVAAKLERYNFTLN